jgi:hypothetical protein
MNNPNSPSLPADLSNSHLFPDESTQQLEKAGWIVFWLCFVPVLGGFFSLATIVLGIILIVRNRLNPGLLFLIVGPIANGIMTLCFGLLFFAGIFSAFFSRIQAVPGH